MRRSYVAVDLAGIELTSELAMCDQLEFEYLTVIRGHHVYKDIFTPTIGKTLQCRRESGKSHDSHAVATIENDAVVGHIPRNISVPCDLFLSRGGSLSCVITGARQYSSDLAQGGLEVPCKLIFNGPVKDVSKLQSLLQRAPKLKGITDDTIHPEDKTKVECSQESSQAGDAQDHAYDASAQTSSTAVSTPTIKIDDTDSSSGENEELEEEGNLRKKAHIEGKELLDLLEGKWLQIEKCILTVSDKSLLVEGKRLNDHHINFAQCLLRRQFESLPGLRFTLLQAKKQQIKIADGIQIIYLSNRLHWCVTSNMGCEKMN